jgi:hypothetical protein
VQLDSTGADTTTRAGPNPCTRPEVRVADARAIARDWVRTQAGPGLVGAFLTGSSAVGTGDAELPATSDLDLIMVTAGAAPTKIGKLWCHGVLLDISGLAVGDLDAETIAGTSYLAPFFTAGMIMHDPTGRLARLSDQVRPLVERPEWVRRRVAEVRTKITAGLQAADPTAPLAQQLIGWVFSASLPTVLLLVAAGRPPTVRKRYLRCRELLASSSGDPWSIRRPPSNQKSPLDVYEDLLEALGCAMVTADQVRHRLDALAETLQVTAEHARTTFPFSSDLRPDTWHLALDGSAELVECGWHREAVWWLLATYARCQHVLAVDAPPDLAAEHEHRLAAAAEDLIGFRPGDGPGRAISVLNLLPEVDSLAEALVRTE